MKTKLKTNKKALANERAALKGLAKTINEEAGMTWRAGQSLLQHALACGKALIEAKESLKHGEFEPWVEKNCDPDIRTCQHYMKLAKNEKNIRFSDFRNLTEACVAAGVINPPKASAPKQIPQFTGPQASLIDLYTTPKAEPVKAPKTDASHEADAYMRSIGIKSASVGSSKPELQAPKANGKRKSAKASPVPIDPCEHLRELVAVVMTELEKIGEHKCIVAALYPLQQWLVMHGKAV